MEIKKTYHLKKKRYRILFISTYLNYFVNNHPSFNRMYEILNFFHRHEDFDVVVLQPRKEVHLENLVIMQMF